MEQYIYSFAEGAKKMKDKLGGKGASLAEMTDLGLPVPPGMTIITDVCNLYYENGESLPEFIIKEVKDYLEELETKTGKKFGGTSNPLLVSVRSGAAESMPGMMDTILNVGLNQEVAAGLAKAVGSKRFAYDSYRRLLKMFGTVVYKIPAEEFKTIKGQKKQEVGLEADEKFSGEALEELTEEYQQLIYQKTGTHFPQTPEQQLIAAVEAVFASWNNSRAVAYRESQGLDHSLGTAVTIQTMVFGNLGSRSGTGVVFSRNPSTGEKGLYGEYLPNAQGEEVVGGGKTPQPINKLSQELPAVFLELKRIAEKLEKHYRDLQDIEFTIEDGQLYLLQTRTGKRTARADIKIAVDLVEEGLITTQEALLRIDPEQLKRLLHPQIDNEAELEIIAEGLAASPGAAVGKIVFSPEQAQEWSEAGEKVILVSAETSPEDIEGVMTAEGILTIHGGMTSHAAVVARGVGKPCVSGCEEITLQKEEGKLTVGEEIFTAGDYITIDGTEGRVIAGRVAQKESKLSSEAEKLLAWADEEKTMQVVANADNQQEAAKAIELGAAGIGLCRTEHMFRGKNRIQMVRDLILGDVDEQQQARTAMQKLQEQDCKELLLALDGRPLTIRLLDAPLHEFLPAIEELTADINQLKQTGNEEELAEKQVKLKQVTEFTESNPMLGLRGCRLGISRTDIYKMQVEAILAAASQVANQGVEIEIKIMVPLISHVSELQTVKQLIKEQAEKMLPEGGVDYEVGTMIELPRACVTADQIAPEVDFFSFGTNDLTQTTFGFSRDDVENKFLTAYLEAGILPHNPFVELDKEGVGRLIEFASRTGKKKNVNLQTGVCGEQGGNPASIVFCQQAGMDYVSCSPYRIPIARLAAAQAKLKQEERSKEKIA